MTDVITDAADVAIDEDRLGEFMGSMVGHLVGAATIACAVLGNQLGLYKAMAGQGAVSADGLASAASTHPRLTREWLDQQASSGIVSYDADGDTYTLSNSVLHLNLNSYLIKTNSLFSVLEYSSEKEYPS